MEHLTPPQGGLSRFKNCHGIREIGLNGEKLSDVVQAVDDFKTDF